MSNSVKNPALLAITKVDGVTIELARVDNRYRISVITPRTTGSHVSDTYFNESQSKAARDHWLLTSTTVAKAALEHRK